MKFSYNRIEFELNDNLSQFNKYIENPFIVFEKKNLLKSEILDKLTDEANHFHEFDHVSSFHGEKKSRSINGNNVSQLQNGVLKDFCKIFLSRQFFYWFKKTHIPFFEYGKDRFIYIYNPDSIFFRIFRKISHILNIKILHHIPRQL